MGFRLWMTLVLALLLPRPLGAQTPAVDYHQHLFSSGAAALVTGNPNAQGIEAKDVIALLDSAGIRRALVLSVAYTWGKATRPRVSAVVGPLTPATGRLWT